LTQGNLHAVAADGNELGGHKVTHPDLTTGSSAAAAAEMCDGGPVNLVADITGYLVAG